MEQRWKKRISKNVQLWNKQYWKLKGMNKGGWNEDKHVEEASALYQSDTGEVFRFAKCVPVLHKLPKFDPMVDPMVVSPPAEKSSSRPPSNDALYSCDEEDDVLETMEEETRKKKPVVNNRAPPQGSNLERPMGMKKAKLIKKLENAGVFPSGTPASLLSSVGDTDKTDNVLVEMSSATKDLVAAMTSTTALKQDELRMRQHEKWMKMASFYVSIGERDRALVLMAKIRGDEKAMEQSKSAGHSTPNKEPEDEREAGEVDDINIEALRPNDVGAVDGINIEAPGPNDAGEEDDDNMEVMMQEEIRDERVE